MVTLTIPGPELQSQNRVDVNYEKTFGLGAQLTKALWKSNILDQANSKTFAPFIFELHSNHYSSELLLAWQFKRSALCQAPKS